MPDYMSVRDAYREGYDHGWSLASWNDLPELGTELSKDIDWIGVGTVDSVESQLEAWECILGAADDYSRCYSPFEFTAHAINARDAALGEGESEAGWDAFERGMRKAQYDYRRKHYPLRELRKRFKEWKESN